MLVPLAFLATVLIWGSTWYGITLQLGVVHPAWSLAYRFALSAVVMVAVCLYKRKQMRFEMSAHKVFVAIGLLLFSGNYFFVYSGTGHLASGMVALIFSLMAVMNNVNGRLFLGNPIQNDVMIAAVTGIVGLFIIFYPEMDSMTLSSGTGLGILLCVLGSYSASCGNTVVASKSAKKLPLLSLNAWGMIYGTLFNIIFALFSGAPMAFDPAPSYWLSLIFLAIPGTVIAFSIYLWLIDEIGLARTGYSMILIPIVALAISTVYEGYVWTVPAILGLALTLVGNVIVLRRKKA